MILTIAKITFVLLLTSCTVFTKINRTKEDIRKMKEGAVTCHQRLLYEREKKHLIEAALQEETEKEKKKASVKGGVAR
jgi:hypothetical protein